MELVYAAILIVVVMAGYFMIGEKRVKKNSKKAKSFLNWMNIDMLTSVGVFVFCLWVWLKLNLDNGNVVALQKGWMVLAELSITGIAAPSLTTFRIVAAIPSVIEWWLLQFNPEGSTRHTIGWFIIGLDVLLLTTIGYWFAAGLTTNLWELTLLHFAIGVFFLMVAVIVNAYLELVAHDSLTRFWLTLRGEYAKGDLNKESKPHGEVHPQKQGSPNRNRQRRRRPAPTTTGQRRRQPAANYQGS